MRINAPARNDSSGTGASTTRNSAADNTLAGGNSTGTSTGSSSSGTGILNALGGGIPGFSSTIPLPSQPGINTMDGSAAGGNATISPISPSPAAAPGSAAGSTDSTSATSALSDGANSNTASGSGNTSGSSSSGSNSGSSSTATNSSANKPDSSPEPQERTEASVGADGQLQLTNQSEAAPENGKEDASIRAVERVNVAVNANGQITLRQEVPQVNASPSGIMLVEVSQQQQAIQIEIADFRRSEVSQYRATLLNGDPLPSWIQIDARTGKVTALPASNTSLIELKFIAEDASGSTRTLEIKIDLSGQRQNAQPAAEATTMLTGRSAFSSQLAMHHQQWDGYGQQILSAFTEPS